MIRNISGVITSLNSIETKFLTVKLCFLKSKGLREEVNIVSSNVFNSRCYVIEYDEREIYSGQEYCIEFTYEDLRLQSTYFYLGSVQSSNQTLIKNIDMTLLTFFVEITGNVKSPRGHVCPGISVRCEQVSLMGYYPLKETLTDVNGNYIIVFEVPFAAYLSGIIPKNLPIFKTNVDIRIMAFDKNLSVYSEIFCDVKNKIEHDFVFGSEPFVGLSIADRQKQVFENLPGFMKTEKISIDQIEYICKKTGMTTNEVTRFVNAKNMSIEFKCVEDILFALLDENGDDNYTSILFKTDAELIEKVNNAIDNNIIYISKDLVAKQISDLKEAMANINYDSKFIKI